MGMRQYFIVTWICISLMSSDAKHLVMYLLASWVSSLEKCLLSSSIFPLDTVLRSNHREQTFLRPLSQTVSRSKQTLHKHGVGANIMNTDNNINAEHKP